jgi:hypothetical protein
MVEPGFVGHTFEDCDQMFRRHDLLNQVTEDNDEVEVLPELVDSSDDDDLPELVDSCDDDAQLPDLEEAF